MPQYPIKALVVSVNYDDLLSITLPRNARFFTEVLVITHPKDERTKAVVKSIPSVKLYETEAFYLYGAEFNKGLAIEEAFDVIGRDGWMCVFDADTLLPDNAWFPELEPTKLYGAKRYVMDNQLQWHPGLEWWNWSYRGNGAMEKMFPGYFHLWHANDPKLVNDKPWYDVTFRHAGGGDGFFQSRWSYKHNEKIVLPFNVLHIGQRDRNWFGRSTPRLDGTPGDKVAHDKIERFHRVMGWCGAKDRIADPSFSEHIEVPGHSPRNWVHERWC